MIWDDVIAALKFWNNGDNWPTEPLTHPSSTTFPSTQPTYVSPNIWTQSEKDSIIDALDELYHSESDTAKEVLNAGIAKGHIWLFKNNSGVGSHSFANSNSAFIDFSDQSKTYMGLDGELKFYTLKRILIHELIHGNQGLNDLVIPGTTIPYGGSDARAYNDANFDHLGETVRRTNEIMMELGEPEGQGRAGFDAHPNGSLAAFLTIKMGVDYAPFGNVELAYFDSPIFNSTHNSLDTSMRTDNSSDLLFGLDQNDTIRGGAGADYLYGGTENDTLYGGRGLDLLHGGTRGEPLSSDGVDTADYSEGDLRNPTNHGITIDLNLGLSFDLDGQKSIRVSDDGYGDVDHLFSVEKIVATSFDDIVKINGDNSVLQASSYALSSGILEIDGGAGEDTLDFTQFTGSIQIPSLVNGAGQAGDVSFKNFEIVKDSDGNGQVGQGAASIAASLLASAYSFVTGVHTIYGNGGDDILVVGPNGQLIDGGAGEDLVVAIGASNAVLDGGADDDILISLGGQNNQLFGGAGEDKLFAYTPGAQLTGGADADTFYYSNHAKIMDATPEDQIVAFGLPLWGGQRWEESEDPWAYGAFLFRYGKNQAGDLVIESAVGDSFEWDGTFVANPNVDPTTPLSERTAGLLVFEYEMERILLVNNDTGKGMYEFFQLVFGYMYKALLGVSLFEGVDPLVLDLDGDGLELTARTNLSPVFDLDGDGFAEQTGWVRPDDGLLAYDQNANGQIDDIGELFGNPTTSGFAELAAHDTNADGVINAQDAIFPDLRVWSWAA